MLQNYYSIVTIIRHIYDGQEFQIQGEASMETKKESISTVVLPLEKPATKPTEAPGYSSSKKSQTKKQRKSGEKAEVGSRRGIETLFRNSYRAHLDLIALATTKANIMISINGLILSFLFISEAFVMTSEPLLEIPTVIFLLTCFLSMAFAILAALPARRKGDWNGMDFTQDRASLLIFEDYTVLEEGDYVGYMRELLKDSTRIYDNMAKQLYFLGTHANSKMKRLQVSYSIFITGLGLSILASFGVLVIMHLQDAM